MLISETSSLHKMVMRMRRTGKMKLLRNLKKGGLHQTMVAGTIFLIGGSALHMFVMVVDYFLMPAPLNLDLHSDFFGVVMAPAMIPMVTIYGSGLLTIYFIWQKAKKAVALAYKRDMQRKKAEDVVETMQRITVLLSDHISAHNAEILRWVENRKKKTGNAPPSIEASSRRIDIAMKALSEVSFLVPYSENGVPSAREFEIELLRKLLLESAKDRKIQIRSAAKLK